MSRLLKTSKLLLVGGCVWMLWLGPGALARERQGPSVGAEPPRLSAPVYVSPYFSPWFGGFGPWGYYGIYSPPFIDLSRMHTTHPYLPKYWWVERYPSADPRQAGYNPNAGYPKEEVATLLLVTYPVKTRVILDGIFVGTSDNLGPIQLPLGVHTLRVEAPGFEPSQTVMNIETPTLQQLEVRLNPKARVAAELQK